MPRLVILLLVILTLTVAPGAAQAAGAPSAADARAVIRQVLTAHAELLGGRLVIGPCRADGRLIVCHARITGRSPQRYRVTVRDDGENWDVHARELP